MTTETLDDLELELRKLPGVRSIGFSDRDDVLLVQVHVVPEHTEPGLALQATRLASRHSERPVAVELVRWRTLHVPAPAPAAPAAPVPAPEPLPLAEEGAPAPVASAPEPAPAATAAEPAPAAATTAGERRVRLLAVLTFPDTDELEVHLTLGGKRSIGRAAASRGLLGAVEATLDALDTFEPELGTTASWARTLESAAGEPYLVGVGLQGPDPHGQRHGLATGASPIEAAARATLHAVNRLVSRPSLSHA
ncbi:MAG: hypothetical protein U0V73_13730 [Acidimicrobiia bacterium]